MTSPEAIYENGILRPATPVVGLSDGQRVWVRMDAGGHLAAIQAGIGDVEAGRVVAFEDVDTGIDTNDQTRAVFIRPLPKHVRKSAAGS